MADVALGGLVKEGVSGVVCVARDLLPGAVLALDAVAAQMASLDAGFATLDPGHLGDLGQSSGLGSCSTGHPGGHHAAGGRGSGWFCHSAHAARQADNAFLSHQRQVVVGDHGEVARGDVHRHAGVLDEQVLHRAGLRCGSLRQVDEHPSLLVGLRHTGVGSLQLSCHLFYLPKQKVAQTLKHDCLCCQVLMMLFVVHKEKAVAAFFFFFFLICV